MELRGSLEDYIRRKVIHHFLCSGMIFYFHLRNITWAKNQGTGLHDVMLSVTTVIMKVQMSRRTLYIRSFHSALKTPLQASINSNLFYSSDSVTKIHLGNNRTWNQTTTDRHDRSAQTYTTVQYSVYTEPRLQCWNRSDASNKPTVGGAREGRDTVQTWGRREGRREGDSGGLEVWEGGQQGWGQDSRYQATKRSESPHQSLSRRTQCMRRNNATLGAREELHFLFKESVSGK